MLNVVDGGSKAALRVADDAIGHFLGRKAVELPDNADDRNVDLRKNIHWRTHDYQRAENQDKQRHHHEGIRAIQRQSNNPHLRQSFVSYLVWTQNIQPEIQAGRKKCGRNSCQLQFPGSVSIQ